MRQNLDDPRVMRAVAVVLVVIAAVMLVQTFGKAHRAGGYDFASYLLSASALAHGTDPYHTATPFPYIYPLTLAFVLIPLAAIPYDVAVALWFLAGVACLWAAARLVAGHTEETVGSRVAAVVALLCLLGFLDPVQINLLNGQVNTEMLLLCLLFFDRYRKKRWAQASVFLAAAIAIKLLPALLLLFVLVRREARIAVATLAGASVFCLMPIVVAGSPIFDYYRAYVHEFLLGRLRRPNTDAIGFTPGRSLGGLLSGPFAHYALVALVVALLIWIAWRSRDDKRSFTGFCAFLAATPLLSPMSEVHHLLLALPAAILLSVAALEGGHRTARASVIVFWCGLWIGRLDRTGPFYFLALAALLVGLVARLRRERRASAVR